MNYTINFRPHGQDQLVINHFESEMLKSPEFGAMFTSSVKSHRIDSSENIRTFVSGSDHYEGYYSSNTPAQECESILDVLGINFSEEKFVYDAF